jgi:hypothetical protein
MLRDNYQGTSLEGIRLNRPKPSLPGVIEVNGSGGIANSQAGEQHTCAWYFEAWAGKR